jgi:polyhydroxyalkanoate synthesis regulator phasin
MASGPKEEQAEAGSERAEQSIQAFREAIEKSVTISRERLQEIVDDAVRRGRMTRGDAEEIVNRVVVRGRDQAEEMLGQLERLLSQIREVPERARSGVGTRAESARRRAVGAVDKPLAGADRVRPAPGFPGSRSPPTTSSRSVRSTAGSSSSPGPSCGRSATTSVGTRPARGSSVRSIESCSPSDRYFWSAFLRSASSLPISSSDSTEF